MSDHRASSLLYTPMPRRRFLHTLGAAGGVALLGSTGLTSQAYAAKRSTIRIFNNETDPDTIAFLRQMAKTYKAETGVRVKIETVYAGDGGWVDRPCLEPEGSVDGPCAAVAADADRLITDGG